MTTGEALASKNCFECKVSTNNFHSLGDFKSHIYCNHAYKSEIFSKPSFVISNDFVCNFCISKFRIVKRMKNHIHCLHASETLMYLKATSYTGFLFNPVKSNVVQVKGNLKPRKCLEQLV